MVSLVKEGALGSVLVRSQIITEEDIKAALEEQEKTDCRFGEALVKLGIVTQEDIDWALSSQLNIPYVRLKPEMIDEAAVRLVPGSLARKFNLIPIFRDGDEISIALADPLNMGAIEAVEQLTGCRVTVSIPIIRELREMLDIFYGSADEVKTLGFVSAFFPAKILESINRDTGGARFLDFMLLYIIRNKLNSISLQPLGDVVSVIGKQGRLTREIGRLAIDYYPDLLIHIRKLGRMKGYTDISAKGILELPYNGEKVFFQVLTLKGHDGDYVTLKTHMPVSFPGNLAELGLPLEKERAFREMVSLKHGVILVSSDGMEDCHRMIDLFLEECDTTDKTVMILGDDSGKGKKHFPRVSFQKTLKTEMEAVLAAVLEHDPDILVLDNALDRQIFTHAVHAAMRGKLVLCGAAFQDTGELIKFLMGFQPHSALLSHVCGIISLKVGMAPCPHCSSQTSAPGCSVCGYTGLAGKRYLADIVPVTGELIHFLATSGDAGEIVRYLEHSGFCSVPKEWNELLQTGSVVPGA